MNKLLHLLANENTVPLNKYIHISDDHYDKTLVFRYLAPKTSRVTIFCKGTNAITNLKNTYAREVDNQNLH